MTKVKAVHGIPKNGHKNLKNGAISKKKHPKFKKTPKGKVALINGSQAQSNGHPKSQKNGVNLQSQKKSPKGGNKQSASPRASTSGVKFPQIAVDPTEEKDDTDSSDEDINEGITIKEEVSAPEDEVDDDDSSEESSSEGTVKVILGTSLADETDEDDEEFDADSDAEAAVENKGVKMFKGLKQDVKAEPSSDDDDAEEEDEEDEGESEEDEEDEEAAPGLAALLGESIADESDDEEFQAAENTSDDDEEVSDSDEEDAEVSQSVKASVADSSDDNDEDEEDDEDDADSSPDLTALLGKSIADDEDDEDFEGEEDSEEDEEMSEDEEEEEEDEDEDEDVAVPPSPAKKAKVAKSEKNDAASESPESKELTKEEREERDKRTIFIGNVSTKSDKSALWKKFRDYGIIESMRLRGVVPENPKMSYKVAAIIKKNHPKVKTVCYFISYKDEDSANNALAMNGKKWDGNILRVDKCNSKEKPDKSKGVFLGNLPFTIEDNELWALFKQCGKINSVRIIRDRKTGLGRGIGYINFEAVDGAVLAMDLNGTTIQNRQVRVKPITPEAESKRRNQKRQFKRSLSETAGSTSPKKIKTGASETVEVATHNSVNAERRKIQKGKKKRSQGEEQRVKSDSSTDGKGEGKYQGQKADAKKKPKQNKSAKKKKQMAAKLLAKPKKPAVK